MAQVPKTMFMVANTRAGAKYLPLVIINLKEFIKCFKSLKLNKFHKFKSFNTFEKTHYAPPHAFILVSDIDLL